MGAALTGLPKLVTTPEYKKPLQGKGKPDKIFRNGRANQDMAAQLFGRGGGVHSKVITKAFTREQKRNVAANAAISGGLTAAFNGGAVKRGVQYGTSSVRLRREAKRTADIAGKGQYLKTGQEMGAKAAANFRHVGKPVALMAGVGAGLTAIGTANGNRKARLQPVAKMSDTELRRRKKLAGHIAVTTSTLGLGSLGALGPGAALKKPRLTRAAATGSIVSGGIGGAGGYNYAAIQRAEAKRRVAKAFDAERSRRKRAAAGTQAAATASAVGVGGAGYFGAKGLRQLGQARDFKRASSKQVQDGFKKPNLDSGTWTRTKIGEETDIRFPGAEVGAPRVKTRNGKIQGPPRLVVTQTNRPYFRDPTSGERLANGLAQSGKLKKLARTNLKRAGGLAALGVGGAVAADRIASYSRTKGKSYAPRYRRPE